MVVVISEKGLIPIPFQISVVTGFTTLGSTVLWNFGLRGLDRLKGTKILFKYGEERSIGCDCTYEEKRIFLGFTQNGCYGNQPHPFGGFDLKH